MIRLFAALRPPPAMRAALLALAGDIAGARWQDDDQLHLTLRFIGEVDRHMAEDIALALARIRHSRLTLALSGIGSFTRDRRPDSIWAGVAPHGEVGALHRKVDAALVRIGVAPDRRAYLPHITIARLGRSAGPIDGFVAAHAGLTSGPHDFAHLCLYESTLGASGARYEIVMRTPLD